MASAEPTSVTGCGKQRQQCDDKADCRHGPETAQYQTLASCVINFYWLLLDRWAGSVASCNRLFTASPAIENRVALDFYVVQIW